MRVDLKGLILLSAALCVAGFAAANSLTPPREPKENSFYVCYEKCRIHHTVRAPLATYRKYQYLGCTISRTPCDASCVKRANCPPYPLKLFGWFNNYPQTLNAFYRCAYS